MFTEDLSDYFDTTYGFALDATLQGGAADGVQVIFDVSFLEQLGIAGKRPVALVQASQVVVADVGKTLTIGSDVWTIKGYELQDDGALALLTLKA